MQHLQAIGRISEFPLACSIVKTAHGRAVFHQLPGSLLFGFQITNSSQLFAINFSKNRLPSLPGMETGAGVSKGSGQHFQPQPFANRQQLNMGSGVRLYPFSFCATTYIRLNSNQG